MNQNNPMTPTTLSPAAQAVLDAAAKAQLGSCYTQLESIAAAALRAAADQVVPPDPCGYDCCITVCEEIRSDFLAIAAELEGSN
jgi:hypothetical protein